MNSMFQLGDRVVCICTQFEIELTIGLLGTVDRVDPSDRDLVARVKWDIEDLDYSLWMYAKEIQLEQLYNSPLEKALR